MTSERDAPCRHPERPSLPANRTFVVQFRAERVAGRVEHLVSGQSSRFDSWRELQGFVERVLEHTKESSQ